MKIASLAYAGLASLGLLGSGIAATPAATSSIAEKEEKARCAAVKPSQPVVFHGKKLVEIVDIGEPELRFANALVSAQCFDAAGAILEPFTKHHPRNRNARFVLARMLWRMRGLEPALELMADTLEKHPDFASMKVLLAGILIHDGELQDAIKLLDEAEAALPDDVWLHIRRRQVEAQFKPTDALFAYMLEMGNDERFSTNVRAGALLTARNAAMNVDDRGKAMWAEYELNASFTRDCRATELAKWLNENVKFDEASGLLESPSAARGNCLDDAQNRLLLAYAYVGKASMLGPHAAAETTAPFVKRARELTAGNLTPLTNYLLDSNAVQLPLLQTVARFVDPKTVDSNGETAVCHAAVKLRSMAVRWLLDAGADANGTCGPRRESLVEFAVSMRVMGRDALHRLEIVKALLEHGAKPAGIETCRKSMETGSDCAEVLKLLEQKSG